MSNKADPVRLLITTGEPAGIGPDITLRFAMQDFDTEVLAIADPAMLAQRAEQLGLDISLKVVNTPDQSVGAHQAGQLNIIPVPLNTPSQAGQLDTGNSQYVLDCLDLATDQCLTGAASAMVTGPVHKGIINDAGFAFTGHTEYLAERSHTTPVMMLATDELRVALATTHLPLREVSNAINRQSLDYTIQTLHDFLRQRCAIEHPVLLVCGLNPHAGEGGHLGREEIDTIQPVIDSCIARGMNIIGALPADTLFTEKYLSSADAVLAMYHDQGLPVLKYSGFGKAVNITLGLPFIRTSVDHGTALELAGTGKASSDSLYHAIKMAKELL